MARGPVAPWLSQVVGLDRVQSIGLYSTVWAVQVGPASLGEVGRGVLVTLSEWMEYESPAAA
jgi:hypothetical protein